MKSKKYFEAIIRSVKMALNYEARTTLLSGDRLLLPH